MRNSWTDDRLDHLNHRVDEEFKLVGQRLELIQVGAGLIGTLVVAVVAAIAATN